MVTAELILNVAQIIVIELPIWVGDDVLCELTT